MKDWIYHEMVNYIRKKTELPELETKYRNILGAPEWQDDHDLFLMYKTYLQNFEDSKYIKVSGKLRGFNVSENRGSAQQVSAARKAWLISPIRASSKIAPSRAPCGEMDS